MSEFPQNQPDVAQAPPYERLLAYCRRGGVLGPVVAARMKRVCAEWRRLFPSGDLGFGRIDIGGQPPEKERAATSGGNSAWDRVLEVLLTSLASSSSTSVPLPLLPWLQSSDWEVRAVGQLALAFHWRGMGGTNAEQGWEILQEEHSPYAKVCACWIPALAIMGQPRATFNPEAHFEDESSFNRDAAALAYGFSRWKTVEFAPLQTLLDDSHPYVRETACVGIGIACEGTAHHTATQLVLSACSDPSEIVRTGAFLALGLLHLDRKADFEKLAPRIPQPLSPAEHRCLAIAYGLAQVADASPVHPASTTDASWGHDIQSFLLGASKDPATQAMRRSLLPVFYYGAFGSFWWGLWLVGTPGLFRARRYAEPDSDSWPRPLEPPSLSCDAAVVYQFLQGLRGKFEVQRLVIYSDGLLDSADFGIGVDALARYDALHHFVQVSARRRVSALEVHGVSVLQSELACFRLDLAARTVVSSGKALPTIEQDVRRLFSAHGFRLSSSSEAMVN